MILAAPQPPRISASDLALYTLSERAMTVHLHLSAWRGQRLDRDVTRRVLDEHHADRDAGRFATQLVPPAALEDVTRAHARARARHHALTLPWGEDSRILSATAFPAYTEAMDAERTACERAHEAFCDRYPDLVASAPFRLNGLYRAGDFPAAEEIRRRFGFRLVLLPVPSEGDFRVQLGEEVEARIRRSIEATVTDRFAEAQRDLWARVLDTVRHFAGTMLQEGKRFQFTTVTKLAEIAAVAPRISLVPDPELESICADILAITRGVDADALRSDTTLRKRAGTDARAAVERIEAAMRGAF